MTLEELIGQTLVFGIPGTGVRPEDVRLFRETHAAGLILYRINFESPAQLRRLIADLEDKLERKLLVTVDHEGGRVVMFGGGVTVFPDNLALGVSARPDHARRQGEIEAMELRRLGIDVNFSPVVDVLTDAFSPNIGIRSYGADPEMVARMATERIRAMQRNGISACAKHFPGLGPATVDPHLDLPVILAGWKEVRRTHLPPFLAAMKADVDLIMSSHPLYPRLDPTPRTPATFSRRLMHDLLRTELGYKGVVSSDDLEMGALKNLCSPGQTAVLAAKAGHDLLLSCHDADHQRQVHAALVDAYKSGELSVKDLEASVERITVLREKRKKRFSVGRPANFDRLAERIACESVRLRLPQVGQRRAKGLWFLKAGSAKPGKRALLSPKDGPFLIIYPRVGERSSRIMIEKPFSDIRKFVKKELARVIREVHVEALPLFPSEQDINRLTRLAAKAGTVVYFCLDAHLLPGGRELVGIIEDSSPRFVFVPLLDFYDAEFVRASTLVLTAFGGRLCQIRACLRALFRGMA